MYVTLSPVDAVSTLGVFDNVVGTIGAGTFAHVTVTVAVSAMGEF